MISKIFSKLSKTLDARFCIFFVLCLRAFPIAFFWCVLNYQAKQSASLALACDLQVLQQTTTSRLGHIAFSHPPRFNLLHPTNTNQFQFKMPLISKKQELDKVTLDLDQDVLKDSDEIFYCEISKEIFRNYE